MTATEKNVSQNELQNNVSSQGQLANFAPVWFEKKDGAKHKLLVIGNSITWHSFRPSIGWYGDWGMAASAQENDFVHRLLSMLEERQGTTDLCIAQLADWEREYEKGDTILPSFSEARDFEADTIVIRLGENMPKDSAPASKPYFCDMIRYFITPKTKRVVVTDCFWRNSAKDNMLFEIAKEKGYLFCHLSDLEQTEANMAIGLFEHRGVSLHPSDEGMEQIANRIFETLSALED